MEDGDPQDIFEAVVTVLFGDIVPHKRALKLKYSERLFLSAVEHLKEIDSLISRVSQGWALSRMPKVDLTILRLALAEFLYVQEAPLEVVIDEALELCKEFSTPASPKFVNGVLMGIVREF